MHTSSSSSLEGGGIGGRIEYAITCPMPALFFAAMLSPERRRVCAVRAGNARMPSCLLQSWHLSPVLRPNAWLEPRIAEW